MKWPGSQVAQAAQIQENRLEVTREFAVQYKVHVVLKGADTLVCDPEGNLAINPTGNPGMACGGMGDVLTGVIGGFLAQGLSSLAGKLPWCLQPWPGCRPAGRRDQCRLPGLGSCT